MELAVFRRCKSFLKNPRRLFPVEKADGRRSEGRRGLPDGYSLKAAGGGDVLVAD